MMVPKHCSTTTVRSNAVSNLVACELKEYTAITIQMYRNSSRRSFGFLDAEIRTDAKNIIGWIHEKTCTRTSGIHSGSY
nr:hypothetical protein Iba_chr14aCG0900 [Ipomoea batatas]